MYTKRVMEEFESPKHVGIIKNANAVGKVGNAVCGDIMKIYLRINENNIIEDAGFKTFGCAAAIASTSIATNLLIGKTIEEALKIKNSEIIEILGGLPPHKIHCSVLAEEAISAAIEDFYKRKEKAAKKAEAEKEEAIETSEEDE
ncbi:MAG: iron-sulfur cluster assembly scaffold protein [Clostridia bacterium]